MITPKPDNQLLWSPSENQIQSSKLAGFIDFVNQKHGMDISLLDPKAYERLHSWSVDSKEAFWEAIWSYYKVKGDMGSGAGSNLNKMPGSQWFPDAKLNFAENLLRGKDSQIALIERGEDGRRETISYATLRQDVAALAAWLRSQGVTPGDRVAAFLPNSRYAVVGMLATASLGAIWSSCSPDFGLQGVIDRFAQIAPKVLIACNGYHYGGKTIETRERVADIVSHLPQVAALLEVPYLSDLPPLNAPLHETEASLFSWSDALGSHPHVELSFELMPFSAPLYILYSSGTTGKPKCIVHSIGGTLLQHLKELSLHTDVGSDSVLFYYTTCGWMMWNWLVSGLALGATLVLFDGSPFHPDKSILFDIAETEGITTFGASAKYYAACEKYGLKPASTHKLDRIQNLLSTGSPLSHESFEYLYRDVKQDMCLSSISGGTDIVSCFALGCPILPVYRGELQTPGLGMALEFYSENGDALESGKGELVCTQPFPSMPIGFWNDDGTRFHNAYFSRFDNIWAHGDYGEFVRHIGDPQLAEQRGVVIHGRSDAVLNPGGVRIGTAEIYRQVEKLEDVFESIAIGQRWEDDVRIVLFVKLKDGKVLDDSFRNTIRSTIRQNTTPRHVPAKIIAVADIPRTLSGKLVELAVRQVVHGEEVKNKDALANPEALELFRDLAELESD